MGPISKLCVFASTPDMDDHRFPVKVLTGPLARLALRSRELGYDGFEFMPDPERVPAASELTRALADAGAAVPVINSGRLHPQGLALLHRDADVRRRSIAAFKAMIDLAAALDARVGLGIARGTAAVSVGPDELEALMLAVFTDLARHAERAGTVVMLEPADPGLAAQVHTVAEAVGWVERLASPGFSLMLDTYQLSESEDSVEAGIAAAGERPTHIHLYDPSRWPPGVRGEQDRLDWPAIMGELSRQGFAGTASVVLAPEGDPAEAARRSVAYLRSLL